MPADASRFRDQKERELRFKLGSPPLELQHWRSKAANYQSLAKNHSQIERVTYRIEGLQSRVEADLQSALAASELWRCAEGIEKKALLVHMAWDFFRTRFPCGWFHRLTDIWRWRTPSLAPAMSYRYASRTT